MAKLVKAGELTPQRRRVYFDLRLVDGLTSAPSESGGQPQISINAAPWTNTGIGTLNYIGRGRYYADLDPTSITNVGDQIESVYSSVNTVPNIPGDNYQVVGFDPADLLTTGLGARTVTITVTDGFVPLETARVRLVLGTITVVGSTDVNGQVKFNVNDGTWSVAIALSGYIFNGANLVVAGTVNQTYVMTRLALLPSDPGLATGYLTCYDLNGALQAGVSITAAVVSATGDSGQAYSGAGRVATSDSNGLVQFPNLFKGIKYSFIRGSGVTSKTFYVTIPEGIGEVYQLPSIIGLP